MMKHDAIQKLYPQVVTIRGDEAFDVDGNPVAYDEQAVQTEVAVMQQNAETHKSSAIAKLTALGLSTEEIKALIGVQA